MIKYLIIALAISLAGCQTAPQKPTIVYETEIVKVPVVVNIPLPDVDTFQSDVKMLTDSSTDGEVAKAFKSDWLTLMRRDALFMDFLATYRKAQQNGEASASGKSN